MLPLDQIADTLADTPKVLRALLSQTDPAILSARPEPGEWSVLEVIAHLTDCDGPPFRNRIEDIINGVPEIAGFDQWAAINERDYSSETLDVVLGEFEAKRAESVEFVRGLDPSTLTRTSLHSSGTPYSAADFLHEWPFHDHDHTQQILANLKLTYLGHVSDAMNNALVPPS